MHLQGLRGGVVLGGVVVPPVTGQPVVSGLGVVADITVVINSSRGIIAGNAKRSLGIEIGTDIQSDEAADPEMSRPVVRVGGNQNEPV